MAPSERPQASRRGCLQFGVGVFLCASLAVQAFACLWTYGMGSGTFYPDNASPGAVIFGLPTLVILGVAWLPTSVASAARVVVYATGGHLLTYGLVIQGLATEAYEPWSWTAAHPVLTGQLLCGAGVLLLAVAGLWSFSARRFP